MVLRTIVWLIHGIYVTERARTPKMAPPNVVSGTIPSIRVLPCWGDIAGPLLLTYAELGFALLVSSLLFGPIAPHTRFVELTWMIILLAGACTLVSANMAFIKLVCAMELFARAARFAEGRPCRGRL